jgi:hypothetical protein
MPYLSTNFCLHLLPTSFFSFVPYLAKKSAMCEWSCDPLFQRQSLKYWITTALSHSWFPKKTSLHSATMKVSSLIYLSLFTFIPLYLIFVFILILYIIYVLIYILLSGYVVADLVVSFSYLQHFWFYLPPYMITWFSWFNCKPFISLHSLFSMYIVCVRMCMLVYCNYRCYL